MDDDAIRALVTSLCRPHRSGGDVIERAAIMAAGAESSAVVAWIVANHGEPEVASPVSSRGLHGPRLSAQAGSAPRQPLRYVLPAGALVAQR
jgi:hypothetical protein